MSALLDRTEVRGGAGGRGPRSWAALALALASGFLLGVLLVAILGGAKGAVTDTETRTRTRTVAERTTVTETTTTTTQAPAASTPVPPAQTGSVRVPYLQDLTLDVAREQADERGLDVQVDSGGGLLGIIDESNWTVVDQDPAPGALLEPGDAVRVAVTRR